MTYAIESHIKPPKRRKAKAVPDNVAKACKAYAEAYKAVYGVSPLLTYSKEFKLISLTGAGGKSGVSLQRLKELTRMMRQRVG